MQTYSHLLINATVAKPLKRRGVAISTTAFVIGGLVPDLPFFILTVLGAIYYNTIGVVPTGEPPMTYMHMTLYFTDPLWIASHNFFHAPFILLVIGLVGYLAQRRSQTWGRYLLWFALGAGLHTVIDIFTHAGDGPVILFPFNWTWRFNSPVSYWDPAHYGLIFAPLEHILDVILIFVLVRDWRRKKRRAVVVTG